MARKRKTPPKIQRESPLERSFQYYLRVLAPDLPEPEREYKFLKTRRFRFDFCWRGRGQKVAVELDGGVYSGGRHVTGKGFTSDCEKFNLATLEGWRVLRFTSSMLKNNPEKCIDQIRGLLQNGGK